MAWYYLDAKQKEQGPFQSADMDKWLRHDYLKVDLLVRQGRNDLPFVPLAMIFLRGGRNPFTGEPFQQWFRVPFTNFQKNLWAVPLPPRWHFLDATPLIRYL